MANRLQPLLLYAEVLIEMLRQPQLQVERVCHRHLGQMCASEAQE